MVHVNLVSVPLFLLGVVLVLTAVQSKTIFNEHDEVIGETDQKLQSIDELSTLNEESDEEKRTYRPDVYFPRFSCGNVLYSPRTEICCCGKKYKKIYSAYVPYRRANWKCCGYQYIDSYLNQCCPYFTVISKKHKCPKSKV